MPPEARPERVFLDANVLFSAAWSPDSGLRALWELEGVDLLTSGYALDEARRNLRGRERRARLNRLVRGLEIVAEAPTASRPAGVDLPPKDRPILLAALDACATHLLTGDLTHFGRLLGTTVEGLRVQRPASYLRGRTGGT